MSVELETILVDGQEVPVLQEVFASCNSLRARAGTTGYRGGDSGHGGRTVILLRDEGGTDLSCEVDGRGLLPAKEIRIVVGGDSELRTVLDALRFILATLEREARGPAGPAGPSRPSQTEGDARPQSVSRVRNLIHAPPQQRRKASVYAGADDFCCTSGLFPPTGGPRR